MTESLALGTTVADRYEVVRLLGSGGLAEVYEVRHAELGSAHALKLLTWSHAELTSRMLLEGQIQAQLGHPHIVRVHDVIRHEGRVALLMELVDGPSLEDLVAEWGAQPLEVALDLFAGLLGAVEHAHAAGVLHRDLKPANVLLARTGGGWVPKVSDFGLAKVLESVQRGTRTGLTMGTPGYMAPEQVRDSANVDQRTDVFALGCILFHMLSGRRAFEPTEPGRDVEVTATLERRPPRLDTLLSSVPADVVAAVERATARDPSDRFPDCRSFAVALDLHTHPALASLPGVVAVPLALPVNSELPTGSLPSRPSSGVPSVAPAWTIPAALVLLAVGFAGVGLVLLGAALWLQFDGPPPAAEPVALVPATPGAAPPRPGSEPAEAEPLPEPSPRVAPVTAAVVARPLPDTVAPEVEVEAAPEAPEAEEVEQALPELEPAQPDPPIVVEPQIAAPEAVQLPNLPSGAWSGLIDGRKRMTLRVTRSSGGQLEAVRRIPVGTGNDLVVTLRGALDRGDGTVSMRATTGEATFDGTWDGRTLEGVYRAGKRQEQAWSLVYEAE